MTTPVPDLVLTLTLDKDAYQPGDELAVTVQATRVVTDKITVSATDPATGATATGEVDVPVHVQAAGLQFGVSGGFGEQFTQESGDGGQVVFKTTVGSPAA
jgi:hypothetical protein